MITGLLDKLVSKLPNWGKVVFWVLMAIVGIYGSIDLITKHGFGGFLLRVIFSP